MLKPGQYFLLCISFIAGIIGCGSQGFAATNPITKGMRIELETVFTAAHSGVLPGIPTGLVARPGGGFLLSDHIGSIYQIDESTSNFPTSKVTSTFLDLSSETHLVNSGGRGLLSFEFHPDHLDNNKPGYRKLYTYHIIPDDAPDDGLGADLNNGLGEHIQFNVITEWTVNSTYTGVEANSRREVVRLGHPFGNVHSGGSIVFDDQNYLYLSHGYSVSAPTAQDLSNTLGTVIRIDPLDPSTNTTTDPVSGNGQYRIPSNNPFVNTPGALNEVYSYGLRNPFRMSRDPVSGVILVGDVGAAAREEISPIIAGANNGWPVFEGDLMGTIGGNPTLNTTGPLIDPLISYSHSEGRSVTGGFFYRGSAIPELYGKYVFGDLIQGLGQFFTKPGRLFYFDPFDDQGALVTDSSQIDLFEFQIGLDYRSIVIGPTTFGLDADGEILVAGNSGGKETIYRLIPSPAVPGDYNGDGFVDGRDYSVWRETIENHPGGPEDFLTNSGDGNAGVDAGDFSYWLDRYGSPLPNAPAQIPEPSMFGITVWALIFVQFSKRQKT